jgi:hypothetical protein
MKPTALKSLFLFQVLLYAVNFQFAGVDWPTMSIQLTVSLALFHYWRWQDGRVIAATHS